MLIKQDMILATHTVFFGEVRQLVRPKFAVAICCRLDLLCRDICCHLHLGAPECRSGGRLVIIFALLLLLVILRKLNSFSSGVDLIPCAYT
jgi:hypothetical protein